MMSNNDTEYTTPWVRHLFLWAGFVVLVVVGIWTVVLPAVEDSPVDPEQTAQDVESGDPPIAAEDLDNSGS